MMETADKKTGAARLLCYGLAALLLAAYLFILWGGLHPGERMRPVYRALYVDHTFNNTDLTHYTVAPGEPLAFVPDSGAANLLGAGQWQTEADGSRLTGQEGLLWVRRPEEVRDVTFTLYAAAETPVPVTVELGGETVTEATVEQTPQTVTVPLPQGQEGELLQFTFRTPTGLEGTLTLTEMSLC